MPARAANGVDAAAGADACMSCKVLWLLGALAVAGWLGFFTYVNALACAFGSPNGNCRVRMPWDMNAEDFLFLVFLPLLPAAGFFLAAWLLGRRNRG